jgi:uncharacterized FlaG/YvyC family protein
MDVTMMLTQTIQTLSQPSMNNDYHPGEIAIMEQGNFPGESGGKEASPEDVDKMMQMLEKAAASIDSRISFVYNDKTRRLIMRITDPATHEVVHQIPSKEMVHILENIHDMIGMFIDDKR